MIIINIIRVSIALTHCVPMDFPIKFYTVMSGWSIVYIEGSQVILKKLLYSFV